MLALLCYLSEVQLPCKNFTSACPSYDDSLGAAHDSVEFFVSHSWSVIIWSQLNLENVKNFLRTLYL